MHCKPNIIRSFILSNYSIVINRWFSKENNLKIDSIGRFIMQQVIDKAHLKPFINKTFIGNIIQKR